ncbi:MAG: HEAT repeat domain-containing protein [Bacillota bacterium]
MKKLDEMEFLKELNSYGYNFKTFEDVKAIYTDDKVLIPVILKHLDMVEELNYKEYLVRCLTKRGYTEVTEKLLNEFCSSNNMTYKWVIGNALYEIRDARFINEYINIVKDPKNGSSRQMIVLLLGFIRSDKAKQALIEILHEDHITPHVIDALGKYQDKGLICHLEYFLDEENGKKWITRIERLKKENPDNIEYAYIDSKGAWKYIKKEAGKAIKKLSKAR